MADIRQVAVIGTGIMGAPMAARLAEAGFSVKAWNRSADKAAVLAEKGVQPTVTAAEAAAEADVVLCMLSSGPVCNDVLLGSPGIVSAMKPGAVLLVMSSIPVEIAMEQAEAAMACGVRYVDAPVSGGEKGAIEADPAQVRHALLGGFADSTVFRQHGKRMVEGDFRPGGPAKYQVKDTSTALAFARSRGLTLPVSEEVDRLFRSMVEHGAGELDHSGVILEIKRMNAFGGTLETV